MIISVLETGLIWCAQHGLRPQYSMLKSFPPACPKVVGCWRASERLLKAPSADALVYPAAAARHLYLDAKK